MEVRTIVLEGTRSSERQKQRKIEEECQGGKYSRGNYSIMR
jgi:hypothetical protein